MSETEDDAPRRARRDDKAGDLALVGRSVLIARPADEVYALWRDPASFPFFMQAVERIATHGDAHVWTVRAPMGQTVSLVTQIVEDEPGRLIAWRSTPDSQIETRGRVTFTPAPADRGTVVTADIAYDPPAGDLGRLVAKLFGAEPNIQARHALKRFKMMLETGEIATGRSRRQQESE